MLKRTSKHPFSIYKSLSNYSNVHVNNTSKSLKHAPGKIPKFLISEIFVEEGKSILNMTIRFLPVYNYQTHLHLNFGENIQILPPSMYETSKSSQNTVSSGNEQFFYDMLNEASQQFTNRGIITLIEASPREIMTSKFCTTALTNILRIHSNRLQRDPFAILMDTTDQYLSRNIYVHQLIDRLVEIGEPDHLLTVIQMLMKKRKFVKGAYLCEKLIDQVITHIITGKYTLNQVIDAIVMFTTYIEEPEFMNIDIRSLWIGIRLNTHEINNHDAILTLFQYVDSIPDVSDYIIALIDRIILKLMIPYTYADIRQIMNAMNNLRVYSFNINHMISKWFLMNVPTLKVNQYQEFLLNYSRNRLQEHNDFIEHGLEQFIAMHEQRINNPIFYVRTSHYMLQHRLVNKNIFHTLIKILMLHINRLQSKNIVDILYTIAYLRYQLPTEYQTEFWPLIDYFTDSNLYKLHPSSVIRLLESYIYMNNYTLKFVSKLQETEFQTMIEKFDPNDFIKLQIYDISMTFESSQYPGPIFQIQEKIRNMRIIPEPYIVQVIDRIESSLRRVLERRGFAYQKFLYLDFMPQSNIYIIDVFVYSNQVQYVTKISDYLRQNPFQVLAVLVQAPYHVLYGTKQLIGPQQLRRRHFNRLGIHTVDLDGDECLAMSFQSYLIEDYLDRIILQGHIKMKSLNP